MTKQKYLDLPDHKPKPNRAIVEAIEAVRAEALLLGVRLEPCPLYSDTILMHLAGATWELRSAGSVKQLRQEVMHMWRTIKGFRKPDADVIHTATQVIPVVEGSLDNPKIVGHVRNERSV